MVLVAIEGPGTGENTRSELRTVESLVYPWEAHCNPAAERAEAAAAAWVVQHGLLGDPAVAARFRGVGVGLLAAMAFPRSTPEILELIAQMMAWVFIQDDLYDNAPSEQQQPQRLAARFDRYLKVLRAGAPTRGADAAERALADLGCRLFEVGSPTWQAHFLETMRQFWMDGVVVETYYRSRGLSPDPASYMAMRVQTVGVYLCLDVMELTLDDELDEAVRNDPILRRITWLTGRIIAYVNDMFSYDKERRVGDVNNYLHVMRSCESMSLPAVIDHTVRVHDRELEQLGRLDGTVRDHGPHMRGIIDRYVEGCRDWIAGALAWQKISGRYASGRVLLRDGEAPHMACSS